MRILANENFPPAAVNALRQAGHDALWVRTESPGISDRDVLSRAQLDTRVVVTFDKDFGELAFRSGLPAECGIILFRIAMPSQAFLSKSTAIRASGDGHPESRQARVGSIIQD
jgi:predicted nuclease of predicted toxin-antitoxin system